MHVHILNKVWEHKQGDWDTNTVTNRGTQVSMKLCIGGPGWHGQSGGHKFMYWCMYTLETRCGNRNEVTGKQTHCYTGAYQISIKLCIGIWTRPGQSGGRNSMYWCIVHILNKVWEHKWGDWDTNTVAIQGHPSFHQTMHRGWTRYGQSGWYKFMYWCMYTF